MAIYQFFPKVISRARGSSAMAAAYRSPARLQDERLGRAHDFRAKAGVAHSEVLLPDGAPERWRERERLWNKVEPWEAGRDAQLAREFAIPRELSKADGIALARAFVAREFVAKGMVADRNIHWDIGEDGQAKPHPHVLLSLRAANPDGFGSVKRAYRRAINRGRLTIGGASAQGAAHRKGRGRRIDAADAHHPPYCGRLRSPCSARRLSKDAVCSASSWLSPVCGTMAMTAGSPVHRSRTL